MDEGSYATNGGAGGGFRSEAFSVLDHSTQTVAEQLTLIEQVRMVVIDSASQVLGALHLQFVITRLSHLLCRFLLTFEVHVYLRICQHLVNDRC